MKKISSVIAILLLCAVSLFAQAPEKFTYQAVVRNANNSLVANAQVGMRVSILQGSANGSAVYVETQTGTTNTNGLLTVEIGGGNAQQGSFADINWANGTFFLKTETDPDGGANYSITSTQQMLSVPMLPTAWVRFTVARRASLLLLPHCHKIANRVLALQL